MHSSNLNEFVLDFIRLKRRITGFQSLARVEEKT